MFHPRLNEKPLDARERCADVRTEKENLRLVAGVLKRLGIGCEVPEGRLGIGEMKPCQRGERVGRGTPGIEKPVFETELKLAVFGIGSNHHDQPPKIPVDPAQLSGSKVDVGDVGNVVQEHAFCGTR